ncbi:MAG TPA: protease pro-enzyme activation domain-containing protein [Nitrososphaerales archaeon]|nr:protease pro-enzyme activation domain-containing protein [Nitrososphaerales archaeon]
MFYRVSGKPKLAKKRAFATVLAFLLVFPVISSLPVMVVASPSPYVAPSIHGYKLLGAAPSDLPILVTFAIPLRNINTLDSLVMQISNPASPMYRHFITPQQVKAGFLPTEAYDSLLSSLQARGIQIQMTALDSQIVAEGTVAQFESAIGLGVNTYTNGTLSYYSSASSTTFEGAFVYASNATLILTHPASTSTHRPNSNVTFTQGTFSAKQLQPVYNATSLLSRGFDGTGQTIGLLDFFGSPTIASDLRLFDKTFGFPDAKLNVIPVGPYDPNLGVNVGWSTEVSLDVEVSHAMAPGAAIDLYIANGALPLSTPLAKIVQDDKVTTLSQSFGNFEWMYSLTSYLGGPAYFALNVIMPDQYYALGSAEGITFLSSSGDAGGSGYSSGPEGDLEYPSTSPFVTSVGGTQTYFSTTASGHQSFVQTAWSNIGYVPNLVNAGGGGGGVSILEPKPWYQTSQPTPPSYPNGRLNPDLSLQAGVDPATLIVDSGKVIGEGGTSESSPLLAGLLSLVAQSVKSDLGLINPFIYKVGNNPSQYAKGFNPITFGYIVPWTSSPGFNLATGWGAPNIGELALLMNSSASKADLTIRGNIVNATGKGQLGYKPGDKLTLNVRITSAGVGVTAGTFTMNLQTLKGTFLPTPMTFSPSTGNWTGTLTLGQQSGLTYVDLSGSSSAGVHGEGIGVIFTGYLGSITATGSIYSLAVDPWTWGPSYHLSLTIYTSDMLGKPQPAEPVTLSVQPYSILTNRYSSSGSATFVGLGTGGVTGTLTSSAPDGPVSLVTQGDVYGYAPLFYGIYLQTSYIYPDVAAEPGSVAPGQSLTIISTPIAPVNVYFETSFETGRLFAFDVSVGSNVTASLVSPSGGIVSTANLYYQACAQALRVCNGGANIIYGQLQVPANATQGLYTVQLHAKYGSFTPGGNISGSFYGQVWVSGKALVPQVSLLSEDSWPITSQPLPPGSSFSINNSGGLFGGERMRVIAKIAYPNATSVKYGVFSAAIYPDSMADQYTALIHTVYVQGSLIQLLFDPNIQEWVGNLTLPSPSSQGDLAPLGVNSLGYSGKYDVFVSGLSSDGTPTTTELKAQQPFFVQPYVYVGPGTLFSSTAQGLQSQLAFSGTTITASGALSGDLFLGTAIVKGGNLVITSSRIDGKLLLDHANVTLIGVSGGTIVANDSNLTLKDSSVDSLELTGSRVSLIDSSYRSVTPTLPVITAGGLSKTIGGTSNFNVTVAGEGLSPNSLSAWVDGAKEILRANSSSSGLNAVGSIDATKLNDGVHTLLLTATQSDGLSTTFSTTFSTDAQISSLRGIVLLTSVALGVVAVVALVLGVLALRRRKAPQGAPSAAGWHV